MKEWSRARAAVREERQRPYLQGTVVGVFVSNISAES
jgi:hypothetical protein